MNNKGSQSLNYFSWLEAICAMRHCFNPTCLRPQNPGNSRFCNHCGSNLSLGDRFRGLRNLGRGNQTIFAVDEQMPSRPNCVIQSFQSQGAQPYWSDELLLNLEAIGQQQMLPPLMAVLQQPMRNGSQEQPIQFLVQRYTPGESLAQRLQERGPFGESAIRSLLLDLLPQLERLHRADWVHRDLRPDTILVAPRPMPPNQRAGDPVIQTPDRPPEICRLVGYNGMQFNGLAPTDLSGPLTQANPDASPLSHELERLGYRAPEQIMGQAIPASDLYSLGVTIIQLLTGQRLPHLLDIQNDHWIWQSYLSQPVSPSLVTIVETLLTRATRHRYSSAQAVLDALNQDPLQFVDLASTAATVALYNDSAPVGGASGHENRSPSRDLAQALITASEPLVLKDLIAQITPQLTPGQQTESDRLLQAIAQGQTPKKITQIQANPTDRTQIELPVDPQTGIAGPISPIVAQAYLDLGDYYRDLSLDYRDHPSNPSPTPLLPHSPTPYLLSIAIGITAYHQALTNFEISPSAWSDLGQLYGQLSRTNWAQDSPSLDSTYSQTCLDREIASYHHGLDRIAPSQQPRLYIELQRQIGEAHSALAHAHALAHALAHNDDAIAQWSAAIAAYHLALAQCDADHQPQTYSLLSNHLGTAYWHLALLEQPIDHLQAAIKHYTAALIHDDPDRDPLRSGLIQSNLGSAYLNLAQQEQSIDLLRLAVGAYQIALIYRRADLAPEAHAASQNNLGTALLQLACHPYCDPQGQRDALDQSLNAYAIALASNSPSFDQRQTRINCALAHEQLANLSRTGDSDDSGNDDMTFAHLETALQGYLNSLPDWLPHEPTYPMLSQAVARIADQLLALNLPIDYPLFTQIPEGIWSPEPDAPGPDVLKGPEPIGSSPSGPSLPPTSPPKTMAQVG